MELPNTLLERKVFNTTGKVEPHMLIVLDKITQEVNFSQQLQTENKLFEIAVTFLNGNNGTFNVTMYSFSHY